VPLRLVCDQCDREVDQAGCAKADKSPDHKCQSYDHRINIRPVCDPGADAGQFGIVLVEGETSARRLAIGSVGQVAHASVTRVGDAGTIAAAIRITVIVRAEAAAKARLPRSVVEYIKSGPFRCVVNVSYRRVLLKQKGLGCRER